MKKSLWLHNIRSIYNVGSMFRTADALGIDHIYLSGYTPLPIDRFGRERSDLAKVAIGAEKTISWEHIKDPEVFFIKKEKRKILAIEQAQDSKNIFNYSASELGDKFDEIIIAMGEEVSGMEDWQINLADEILEIPMKGEKESLNVSVAFGVAAYSVFK